MMPPFRPLWTKSTLRNKSTLHLTRNALQGATFLSLSLQRRTPSLKLQGQVDSMTGLQLAPKFRQYVQMWPSFGQIQGTANSKLFVLSFSSFPFFFSALLHRYYNARQFI